MEKTLKPIEESYKIFIKNSKTSKIPIKEWTVEGIYGSLTQINDFMRPYFNICKHIRTKEDDSSLIFTFLSSKNYSHLKIQPILRVKEELEGLVKEKIKC